MAEGELFHGAIDTFANNAGIDVVSPPSVYTYEYEAGRERDAQYRVSQDSQLPIPPLPADVLTTHEYAYLHGFNLAVTLAAITSRNFPGMRADGIAYPFEYSVHDGTDKLNREVISFIGQTTGKSDVRFLEIGGQEGRWGRNLEREGARLQMRLHPVVLDLDITRRRTDNFEKKHVSTGIPTTYIQADAHHLGDVIRNTGMLRPDAIAMINVEDVVFDPFGIFSQAWEMLPVNGTLLVGTSFYSVGLPFTAFVDGCYMDTLANGNRQTLSREMAAWKKTSEKLRRRIPDTRFAYASDGSTGTADIKRIAKALYGMSSWSMFRSDLGETLRTMGYHAETLRGKRIGVVHALVKQEGEANPFDAFRPAGISRDYFHVNEYVFPQLHRFVHLHGPKSDEG